MITSWPLRQPPAARGAIADAARAAGVAVQEIGRVEPGAQGVDLIDPGGGSGDKGRPARIHPFLSGRR